MKRRNKVYDYGDRLNIYLSRNITPELLEMINKQSDISSFFLLAAQVLQREVGNIDVATIIRHNLDFSREMVGTQRPYSEPKETSVTSEDPVVVQPTSPPPVRIEKQPSDFNQDPKANVEKIRPDTTEDTEKSTWANLENINVDDF